MLANEKSIRGRLLCGVEAWNLRADRSALLKRAEGRGLWILAGCYYGGLLRPS